jgi:hypothetical protein
VVVGLSDPKLKPLLSLPLSSRFLLFLPGTLGLPLLLLLDGRNDGLVIAQSLDQFLLLQFEVLMVLEEVSQVGDGELRLFLIDVREAFSQNVADDGVLLEIVNGCSHSMKLYNLSLNQSLLAFGGLIRAADEVPEGVGDSEEA